MSDTTTYQDSDLYRIRHSAAHVLAEAVLDLYPEAKLAIGPPIAEGFYYDFDLGHDEAGKPRTFSPDDLEEIEKRLKKLLKKNAKFEQSTMSVEEALKFFADQPYKQELIEELAAGKVDENGNPITDPVSEVGIYQHRDFVDLCRGPHVGFTKQVKHNAVKVLRSSGAYWRGDENKPQLQRIYGTAWYNKEELDEYLQRLEEIKQRDHRRIGTELDLFSYNEEIGPGLILWHPKGGLIRKIIEDYWGNQHEEGGYDFVYTPHIGKSSLWETSGHLEFYDENMYAAIEIDEQKYYLKPMNCPFHMHIFQSRNRSYRELPLRFAEKGTVYRYERSGVLHGLLRVRGFTQDDAHHFCRPDQMDDELDFVLDFSLNILRAFGLTNIKAYLSTKPEKSVGDPEDWVFAEKALRGVIERAGLPVAVDEGGGAFYGPKIDLAIQDAVGREWQVSTIQFDFNLPVRFDISYVGEDGQLHQPYMLHRALLGSMERFFGLLIEHYSGAFPVWLSPVQAILLPITDRHSAYAAQVVAQLKAAGIRAEVDTSGDRISKKVRNAQLQKIPYMLVVGDQEANEGTVSVRLRTEEDLGQMPIATVQARIQEVIAAKEGL